MTKYNFKLSILISLFCITLVSCNGNKKTEPVAEEETETIPEDIVELRDDQIKLANIETGKIELRPMSGTLKVTGTVSVAPQNMATVSMPMGGFVKSTSLMPGNTVTKGQTLAVIENQEFVDIQQNYLEVKSKLEYTEAEYKRQKELFKNDVSSTKNMQLVTSEYRNMRVQLKSLEQKLSLIGINYNRLNEDNISRTVNLISPISGYIKTVNVSIGKSVSSTDVLFEIVNINKLFIQLSLFEKDAAKVYSNQKIRFFINNESEQHEAIIYQTAKSVDSDKIYKVYATVNGSCENVLPGMYVNAIIEASTNKVTSVPSASIVSFDDKDYIFVHDKDKMENGKRMTEYRMIQVKKGVAEDGYIEIALPKGFKFKDARLIINGAYNLLSAKKNAGEMSC